MKAEKFSYKEVTQQHALGCAKSRVKALVEDTSADGPDLIDGLYLVHAPNEQCYYIEFESPMLRPGLGEEIIWQL